MPSILLIEYFLSGGSLHLASSLLIEGYAMVKAACQALSQAGWETVVLVDERLLPYVELQSSKLLPVRPGGLLTCLHGLQGFDAALAIAPPMEGAHASLVEALEEAGVEPLGPSSRELEAVLDKHGQVETLSRKGVPVPKTELVDELEPARLRELASSLSYPLVFKPRLGAGCEGLFVAYSWRDVEEAVKHGWVAEGYLAQEALEGVHASASVFSDGSKAWSPCLNAQLVEWGRRPSYEGGLAPLSHPLAEEGVEVAVEAVEALRLRGYVGVDLVLTNEGPYVVEVNPRLTTSIVSLIDLMGPSVLGSLLSTPRPAPLSLNELGSLRGACAFVKARARSRTSLSLGLREALSRAQGVYALAPLDGWVEVGEPVAIVKASGGTGEEALREARRLAAMVESRTATHA